MPFWSWSTCPAAAGKAAWRLSASREVRMAPKIGVPIEPPIERNRLAPEVATHGVHVTALCPGFTLTEFHDVTGTRAQVSTMPGWAWSDAREVVQAGYDAVMAGRWVVVPGRVPRLPVRSGDRARMRLQRPSMESPEWRAK